MSRTSRTNPLSGEPPIWVSEPFRVFFPLGIAAAIFGVLLWPLHYAGWWPVYPAIQHPRILIFGFGAAFVFGFLGTAWPRFVEAEALQVWEFTALVVLWLLGILAYAKVAIAGGDLFLASACLWLCLILGRRLLGEGRDRPPAGFALALFAVFLATVTLFSWGMGWSYLSPELDYLHRLVAYQGFLLLPLLGVGSYLFPRFFGSPGDAPLVPEKRQALIVLLCGGMVLISFVVEVFESVRWGNGLRIAAILLWACAAVPSLFLGASAGTRPWALRVGFGLIVTAFLCRIFWPHRTFAFEHVLFLCGFSQLILLMADRVAVGHGAGPESIRPKSLRWRWIVWTLILTAATRAAADLVPSTRMSHHIYAAIMLIGVFGIWWSENGRRLRQVAEDDGQEQAIETDSES